MGVAKSDFSQMRRSRSDLIKNAERFARIDLDLKKNATNNTQLFFWKTIQELISKARQITHNNIEVSGAMFMV